MTIIITILLGNQEIMKFQIIEHLQTKFSPKIYRLVKCEAYWIQFEFSFKTLITNLKGVWVLDVM